MLIHIRPRLFSQICTAELVDFSIEQFGLKLQGGVELVTKTPYRNKFYHVASRKIGRRAVDGLFVETSGSVQEFTTVAHWLHSRGSLVEHIVHYKVLDCEFDAISDDTTMWYGSSPSLGGWSPRWPSGVHPNPVRYEHVMTLERSLEIDRQTEIEYDLSGMACFREEVFFLPTIERERVLSAVDPYCKKMIPDIDHAFKVGG